MSEAIDAETESWQLLVLRRKGSELLVFEHGDGIALPCVTVPRHTRVAHALNAQIKSAWDLDVFSLYPLQPATAPSGNHTARCHVVEAMRHDAIAPRMAQWSSVSALSDRRFRDAADLTSICRWRDLLGLPDSNGNSLPFGNPGCLAQIQTWIRQALLPCERHLTERFVQFTASKSFSLIRFDTNERAIWFKAVGEPNLQELPISRELARRFPTFVPAILGVHENWNAWLTLEVEGNHPDEHSGLETWTRISATLADLQIASIGMSLHLIDAGCRDMCIPSVAKVVEPYFETMADLMEEQPEKIPPPMTRKDIKSLQNLVLEALAHLDKAALPNTLGHLDFNPGNILVNEGRVLFLDWSAGCVGCPLWTLEYLLERLRRFHPTNDRWRSEVLSAYLDQWRCLVRPDELKFALATAPLLAVFAYAVASGAWRDPQRLQDPEIAAHLRSLTRRMNREAAGWLDSMNSRCACVSHG
jgi:hypothetical protein